jgi:hypothetical protein
MTSVKETFDNDYPYKNALVFFSGHFSKETSFAVVEARSL